MPDAHVNFSEILLASLPEMIQRLVQGVAEAQSQLDAAAIHTQETLQQKFPELAGIGYRATWYQIPEVIVELKVAVHYEATGEEETKKRGFFLSPFNAKYKSAFTYGAEGSSTLKLKIVPVPPPVVSGVT